MFKKAIKKSSVLITALIILALSAVGGTAAYLITSDVGENQIFEKPVIRCEVVDTLQQGSAIVRNTGDVDSVHLVHQ